MAKAKKKVTKKKSVKKKFDKDARFPIGRPTNYTPEMCNELLEYFQWRFETVMKTLDDGLLSTKIFPNFEEWYVVYKNMSDRTFFDYVRDHKEFTQTYLRCKRLQEMVLKLGGSLGVYKSNVIQLILQHSHGYKEHKEIDLNTRGKIDISSMSEEELREEIKKELSAS